ncbi:MAG: DNA-binding protein [Coriobacteriales bacterium]|nr:DNA-binding protein [Coriobacteriales bacterium]
MGFFSELKKAASNKPAGESYMIAQKQLVCPHCGNKRFYRSEAQLNTAGLTFINLDWANRSASVFECTSCGRLEWFIE